MRDREEFDLSQPIFSEEGNETPPPQPRRQDGTGRRLWKTWLWLTGPRLERFGTDVAARERMRRSRLISGLLLMIFMALAVLIPDALTLPLVWFPVLLLSGGGLLVALLNRQGLVSSAGIAYVALVDAAITEYLISQPTLLNGNIPDFDLFIIATLIGGMILPLRIIPVTGLLHISIIILLFTLKPHDSLLTKEILAHQDGQGYASLVDAFLLQTCGTTIAWLHAWSVNRAILRASRAEELAEARARLNEQGRIIAEQKQRLEHGIQALQEAQARVANGDYSARATLHGNELLPLAVSFNIMAERLSRVQHIEEEHHRTASALQQAMAVCNALARGTAPAPMKPSGTLVDRIIPFLMRLHQQMNYLLQSSGFADDLRAILQRQQVHLAQVEAHLTSSLTLAKNLKEQALAGVTSPKSDGPGALWRSSGPIRPGDPSGSGGPPSSSRMGIGGAEPPAAVPPQLNIALTQHITLLESARKENSQASELGRHCIQGARLLSQRLKETA
jgi:hypothetical protein